MTKATISPTIFITSLSLNIVTFVLLTIFCFTWSILATYFAIKKYKELVLLNNTESPYNGVLMAQLEFRRYNTQIEYTKLKLIALICLIETASNFGIVCSLCVYMYYVIIDLLAAAHPQSLLHNTTSSNIGGLDDNISYIVFDSMAECLYLVCFPVISLLMYYLKQSYLAKQPQTSFLCKWIVFLFCVSLIFFVLFLIKEIRVTIKLLFTVAVLISVISYFIYFFELYKVLKKRHKESILFDCENKTKHKNTKVIYKRFFILAFAFGVLAIILLLYVANNATQYIIHKFYNGMYTPRFNIFQTLGFLFITLFGLGFDVMSFAGVAGILINMAITTYKRRKRTYRYVVGSIDAYERIARTRLLENIQNI